MDIRVILVLLSFWLWFQEAVEGRAEELQALLNEKEKEVQKLQEQLTTLAHTHSTTETETCIRRDSSTQVRNKHTDNRHTVRASLDTFPKAYRNRAVPKPYHDGTEIRAARY